ncbi:hypothetical protein CEE45_01795 [Candidatus Heimdallarchaeota archaeon B3_Heim]|nr:MAG: hypothetical protein CEE45_01795 [Candidatus Heimdallarchaeota archaeon B3_Heim]
MFCDNCGNSVEDGAAFCPKCGQSLMAGKGPSDVPPPTRSYRKKQSQDNLCFGEENENPYGTGIFFLFLAVFFTVIFFFPEDFPVESLVVLGFLLFGILAIVQAKRRSQ